jgi:ADP-heptose:LPS heptosyltransferase
MSAMTAGQSLLHVAPASTHHEVVRLESDGIGDLVVAAAAVAGIRHERPESRVCLSVRPHLIEWARLFRDAHSIVRVGQEPRADRLYLPYRTYESREIPERGRLHRHQYYAEACATWPVWPRTHIPVDDRAWAANEDPLGGHPAVIVPFAAHVIRNWPASYFAELIASLRDLGYTPVILDSPGDGGRTHPFGVWRYWGQQPGRVAALLDRAALVVGNDSGMIHLAGALGRPTVAVCASVEGESIYGFYPTVRVVQSTAPCSRCYWQSVHGYRSACNLGCAALYGIPPQRVLQAIEACGPMASSATAR